jgi:WD40 repeat protein
VRLWSVVDYTCLRVFEGHTASVLTVKFANKGMQLLSGAADGLIRLWTIRSGECENTFDLHSDRVWAIAVGSASTTPGKIVFSFTFYLMILSSTLIFVLAHYLNIHSHLHLFPMLQCYLSDHTHLFTTPSSILL